MDRNRLYFTNMCKSSIIAHKDFDVTVVTGPMPLALKAEDMVNSQKVRAVLEKSPSIPLCKRGKQSECPDLLICYKI
jgi:hypothetical protein